MELEMVEVNEGEIPEAPNEVASPEAEAGGTDEKMMEMVECWVCRDSVDSSEPGCIKPCLCKGSMGLVHKDCLEEWLNESGKKDCGVCRFKYLTTTEPRYTSTSTSIGEWLKTLHPVKEIMFLIYGVLASAVGLLTLVLLGVCIVSFSRTMWDLAGLQKFWIDGGSEKNKVFGFQNEGLDLGIRFRSLTLAAGSLAIFWTWLFIALRDFWSSWTEWHNEKNRMVKVLPIPTPPLSEPETDA